MKAGSGGQLLARALYGEALSSSSLLANSAAFLSSSSCRLCKETESYCLAQIMYLICIKTEKNGRKCKTLSFKSVSIYHYAQVFSQEIVCFVLPATPEDEEYQRNILLVQLKR